MRNHNLPRQFSSMQMNNPKKCIWQAGLALVLIAGFVILAGQAIHQAGEAPTESKAESSACTTVLVIRHAEKSGGADPDLTESGKKRAQDLVHVLGGAGIKAIFTARVKRARETAEPLRAKLKLPKLLDGSQPPNQLAKEIRENYAGQTVLVIGQAPTIPDILRGLGVSPKEVNRTSTAYDNLFVLNLSKEGKTSFLQLKYGEPVP